MGAAFRLWTLLLAACLAAFAPSTLAQRDVRVPEYQVKAAFISKFGAYIDWPAHAFEHPASPLVIGVLGAPEVVDETARAAAGLSLDGRPIAVRRLAPGDALAGLHIVYVDRSHAAQLRRTLAAARGQPLLTVTESDDATQPAGMINFVVVGNKVRFDVVPHRAEASGLRISARMLSVARRVVQDLS